MIILRRGRTLGLILLLLITTALYVYRPISFDEISSVEGFVRYANSFGPVMPFAVFAITVVQTIIPIVPFVVICSASGLMFGLIKGMVLIMFSTLTGASLEFWVSRRMGYEWAARHYGVSRLKKVEQINGSKGFLIILGLRLMPYFPATLINILAGISRINFFIFLGASLLGKMPFVIGYTLVGYSILQGKNYVLGITLLAAVMILPYLISRRSRKAVPKPGQQQ